MTAIQGSSAIMSIYPRQVVSCDGGGVRGILTARILQGFEEVMEGPITDYVSDFYGTSTGSLIAAGLASPKKHTAEEVVNLYEHYGPKIFHQTYVQELWSANGMLRTKYKVTGLEEMLVEIAGGIKLVDLTRNFHAPVVNAKTRKLVWLSRDEAKAKGWKDILMTDLLTATTAAPTYFPGKILDLDGKKVPCVDAGISENNPLETAAIDFQDELDLSILSIGTGMVDLTVADSVFDHGGGIQWIEPLLQTTTDVQEQQATEKAIKLLRDPKKIFRIQPTLKQEIQLDDASKMDELKKLAADWLKENDEPFREFCKRFKKIF